MCFHCSIPPPPVFLSACPKYQRQEHVLSYWKNFQENELYWLPDVQYTLGAGALGLVTVDSTDYDVELGLAPQQQAGNKK